VDIDILNNASVTLAPCDNHRECIFWCSGKLAFVRSLARARAHTHTYIVCLSQAARQGLAVLMATAEVVLKHETSTTCQSHINESIDLKFG